MKHIILSALGLLFLCSCAKTNNAELYQEIKSVDKMVLAKMSITKTVVNNESFFGKRIAGYSYETYARAYIDLSSLQAEDLVFDESTKTVKVTLPPVQAELVGRDIEMRNVYNNITLFRDDMEEKDLTRLKEEGNTRLKKEWEENPMFKSHIIESAKRKARKYFENIFESNGYVASIDFKSTDNNTPSQNESNN